MSSRKKGKDRMVRIDTASAPAAPARGPRSDGRRHWGILPAVAVIVIGFGVRPVAAQICVGDCSGDSVVTVNEIIECVNIALGSADLSTCSACSSHGQTVVISDLVTAVNNALNGCPATPTAISTGPLGTPTHTLTPSASATATTPTATSTGPLGTPTHTPTPSASAAAMSSSTPTGTASPARPTPTPTATSPCGGKPDGTTCDAGTDGSATLICVSGACAPCAGALLSVEPRFVDNGDGTVTDRVTCLVWEKKSADNGVHDKDIMHTWSTGTNNPDGTAFTVFLPTLDTAPCFAGHCDWRLPREDGQNAPFTGPKELETILAEPSPCEINPCIPPAFNTECPSGCTVTDCSCTQAGPYWSATTDAGSPIDAWIVGFLSGQAGTLDKTTPFFVRAVRGGPDPCAGKPDGTTCDAETDAPQTLICVSGACEPCAASPDASPRFVDNGNGTITDRSTCLVWEKKDTAGGIHDLNKQLTWTTGDDSPNGTAFTVFLAQLNGTGFGEHSDWRLPTSAGTADLPTGQPAEIESIADPAAAGCGSGPPFPPCVDPAFNTNCGPDGSGNTGCTINGTVGTPQCSCTAASFYWSMSTVSSSPFEAWFENFSGGSLAGIDKSNGFFARAVRGGPNPCIVQPDGTTCDAGTDAPQARICVGGTCGPCVASSSASPRFVDTGDGTITDRQTCLVWEKKSDDGSVHDQDNTYTWSTGTNNPDGTVFTDFLATLKTAPCFAGHCDWRLPSEDGQNAPFTGPKELESILASPCETNPCVPPAFNTGCTPGCEVTGCSCTEDNRYWSATTDSADPTLVQGVGFGGPVDNPLFTINKVAGTFGRAVRGGP